MGYACTRCGSPMKDLGVDWVCTNDECDKQQMLEAAQWAKASIGRAFAINYLRALTEEQRVDVFRLFCTHCGRYDPRCQCWNDECTTSASTSSGSRA